MLHTMTQEMLKKPLSWLIIFVVLTTTSLVLLWLEKNRGTDSKSSNASSSNQTITPSLPSIPRVGVQIGHLDTDELPDELWKLRWNYGSESGSYSELEINTKIANQVADYLKDAGVTVDILPATIPKGYVADAFIAIHADGNDDTSVSGYKITWSEFDTSGKSELLSNAIEGLYAKATGMSADSNISSDMTEYYAFNYNKYAHTLDPNTPAAIIETGFVTNSADRKLIVNKSSTCARAIADGILKYLQTLSFKDWPK